MVRCRLCPSAVVARCSPAWQIEHVAGFERRRPQTGHVPPLVAIHLHDEHVVDVGVTRQSGRGGLR